MAGVVAAGDPAPEPPEGSLEYWQRRTLAAEYDHEDAEAKIVDLAAALKLSRETLERVLEQRNTWRDIAIERGRPPSPTLYVAGGALLTVMVIVTATLVISAAH